jgi:hypothetical protein
VEKEGNAVATTIKVTDVRPDMNKQVEVQLRIITRFGTLEPKFKFGNKDSREENVKEAYKELRLWLQELQTYLESHPEGQ